VLLRDGHCRWPGCDARHGLEIHHLVPRSWGGTDQISNLAAVCTLLHHHEQLIPHGPYVLVGNPNQPDGLRLAIYTDLTADEAQHHGLPPPPGRRRPG
jgi:5-methylcytosine-specific restriction endonuclease McrA